MTTPSWLSRSSRLFLRSSSMYSFQLFLISFASVKSLPFLSVYHAHPCMKCFFDISNFLEEILPFLLFSSTLHCSFKKVFLSFVPISATLHSVGYIFPFLPCFSLLFFPQLFVKPPQSLSLLVFLFLWDGFGHCLLYNVMSLCP